MTRSRWIVSLTVFLALAAVACRPPEQAAGAGDAETVITVDLPDAPVVGPTPLSVRVERDGEPVEGATVTVTGDMTHAGMTPVVASAAASDDGSYVTDGFAFTMAGDWILTVEVELEDGETLQTEASTTVARP